jgi:hypothetical protein
VASRIQLQRVSVDYDPAGGVGERESCEEADEPIVERVKRVSTNAFTGARRQQAVRNDQKAGTVFFSSTYH